MLEINLDNAKRYCVFRSGESCFGLPCLSIRRIVPRPEITPVPFSDPVLCGLCHLQNEFLPVVSLRSLINVRYEHSDAEQQMMIVHGPNCAWGLLIDDAVGLAELEISYSSAFVESNAQLWTKAVIGTASYENHALQVLDPDVMFQYAVTLLDMYWDGSPELETEFASHSQLGS